MTWTGRFAIAVLLLAPGAYTPVLPADPQGETAEESARDSAEAGRKGRHFGLYVETIFGTGTADGITPNVETTANQIAANTIDFEDHDHAVVALGWQLPEQKGKFTAVFTGFKETSYRFTSVGSRGEVADPTPLFPTDRLAPEPVPWWNVQIQNGTLVAESTQPTWVPGIDDANNDGIMDLNEIRFESNGIGATRSATVSLENQIQTLDILFQRDWGGRRYNATWGGGLRYLTYEGNVPVGAWLRTDFTSVTGLHGGYQGYTDGATLRLLNFSQKTTGIGPSGYAEVRFNFWRSRFVLFLVARAAFLLSDLETDTGTFFTFVREPGSGGRILAAGTRLNEQLAKDVWNSGGDAGLRVRLLNGLTLHLAYYIMVYHDALLLPTALAIPANPQEIAQGTDALYKTRDFRMDGFRGGFSFQF